MEDSWLVVLRTERRQMGVLFAMVSSEETTPPGPSAASQGDRSAPFKVAQESGPEHQRLGSHLPDSSRRSVPATQETVF